MKLVVAEKPSVGVSIAKVIGATNRKDGYIEGNGYIVTWCVGHLVGLAMAEEYGSEYKVWNYEQLPISPTKFKYRVHPKTQQQFNVIKKLASQNSVTEIINATDAGREGELIFMLVYNNINTNKPVKRLWISSMEDTAISTGFANLKNGSDYNNLYQAAISRAKADWLVGINSTRLFSVLYNQRLNIGRVMTPTLAMIVNRNSEIENFISQPFYNVILNCGLFTVISKRIMDKAIADDMIKIAYKNKFVVTQVEEKERKENPPKLFDLTNLQREANKMFGYTANQTLEYTQKLYEKKLCTYPRTDSQYLTDDMEQSAIDVVGCSSSFLDVNIADVNINLVINNKKVTDHHAIIPTGNIKKIDADSLPSGEKEILQLIALRLILATNKPHIYNETIVTGGCGPDEYSAKGRTIFAIGFKSIDHEYTPKEKKAAITLPPVKVGDEFNVTSELKEGETTPPKQFTDDTLLAAMENANNAEKDIDKKGIGTPATRASILEKIITVGFAERQGDKKTKHFVPTSKGITLISIVPDSLKSPLVTAEWEEKLSLIEKGSLEAESFLNDINGKILNLVLENNEPVKSDSIKFESEKEEIGKCPRCGNSVIEYDKAFFCHNRDCDFAIWKSNKLLENMKKKVTKTFAKNILKHGRVVMKDCYSQKTGKSYDCILVLDDTGGKYVNFKMEFLS